MKTLDHVISKRRESLTKTLNLPEPLQADNDPICILGMDLVYRLILALSSFEGIYIYLGDHLPTYAMYFHSRFDAEKTSDCPVIDRLLKLRGISCA